MCLIFCIFSIVKGRLVIWFITAFIGLQLFGQANRLKEFRKELILATSDSAKSYYHSEICYVWCESNFDSALFHAELSYDYALKSGSTILIRQGIMSKGWAYDWAYKFDSAKYFYKQARTYSKENDDLKGEAIATFNLGVTHYYEGNLDSATNYYLKAEPVFRQVGDFLNLSRLFNNMGRVYEKTGNSEMALEVSRKSLSLKSQLKDTKGIINSLTNMSSIFQRIDLYDSALVYSERSLALAEQEGDSAAIKGELINLGIIYKNLDQPDQAIAMYQQAQNIISPDDEPYILSEIYLNLGEFYLGQANMALTKKYIDLMEPHIEIMESLESTMHFLQLKYAYLKATGQFEKSLESLEKVQELNAEFVDEQTVQQMNALEQLYEKQKREAEIAQLNLDNQNQLAAIAIRNNQRNIFIFSTLIFLLLAGFIFYRFRNKSKTALLLQNKNKQISEALDERELLLKEIHHRVKNNLQVISSLLSLQADSLGDQAAVDAVLEGQSRVKSIAVIHQKLYSGADVRGVEMQDYLENLVEEVFRGFGVDEEKVSYEINAQDLKLDIDTLIPLGLIINELVTNSIKYAFGAAEGLLSIRLELENEKLKISVKDSGKGVNEAQLENSDSFGWKMVNILAKKLKAEISIKNESGAVIELLVSNYKLI